MVQAVFQRKDRRITGFTVSGHAGYANKGRDIVCAAVSSAVELTANGITEILHFPAEVDVLKNAISLKTSGELPLDVQAMLDSFELHIRNLQEQFPAFIQIRYLEV